MLNFYFIQDEQSKSGSVAQMGLKHAGGLEYEIFEALQTKGFIEDRFDYHSDFRWNKASVQKKYNLIKEKEIKSDINLLALFNLLDKAIKLKSGLIAFGD